MSMLDGRSFAGVVLECGKTEGDADTIIFKDGRFRSTACDQYDYGDGAYTATARRRRGAASRRRPKARSTASWSGRAWCAASAWMPRSPWCATARRWARSGSSRAREMSPYHEGARELQDRFDTRRLADRLAEKLVARRVHAPRTGVHRDAHDVLPRHRGRRRPARLLLQGRRCRGSCASPAPSELAFPSYDGNGMFRSLGNVLGQPGGRAAVPRLRAAAAAAGARPRRASRGRPLRRVRGRAARGARATPSASSPTARATSTACSWSRRRPTCRGRAHEPPVPALEEQPSFKESCRRAIRHRAVDSVNTSSLIYSGLE